MFIVFANKKNWVLWLHVTIHNVQFNGSILLALESQENLQDTGIAIGVPT